MALQEQDGCRPGNRLCLPGICFCFKTYGIWLISDTFNETHCPCRALVIFMMPIFPHKVDAAAAVKVAYHTQLASLKGQGSSREVDPNTYRDCTSIWHQPILDSIQRCAHCRALSQILPRSIQPGHYPEELGGDSVKARFLPDYDPLNCAWSDENIVIT